MGKAVCLLFLLGFCQAQVKDSGDKDLAELLTDIFGVAPDSVTSHATLPSSALLPEVTENSLVNVVTEESYMDTDIPPCYTADKREGSCTIPVGCVKRLSPDRPSDKGICSVANEICCAYEDVTLSGVTAPVAASDTKTSCGWQNGQNTRILSESNSTEFAEFPWIVAVLKTNPDVYTCGGSIIHPQVVLTTAHHVFDKRLSFRVRAGDWDTLTTNEELPYQERNVERVIVHELFNVTRLNLFNDVALLVLDRPLEYARHVNAICLPPVDQIVRFGTRCFSSGWGKNEFGKNGAYQGILRKVQIPVVSKPKCQRELRKTRLGPIFKLHNSFMCAGGEANKDTCTGDGGSPLMCPINGQVGRYTATGLVAWGVGCGDKLPAVYADVAVLRPWIDTKMTDLGFGQDTYTF